MMPGKIRRLLAPPVFENDEEKTRIASLLNTILLAGVTLQAVMCIGLLTLTPDPLSALASNGVLTLFLLGALFLVRRGHVRFASMLLTGVLGGFFILTAIMSGGVFSPIFSGYIIVVVIAGMLMGGGAGVAFAVLGAMAALGMLWADGMGYLPLSIIPTGSVVICVGLTTDFILTAVLLHFANRSLNDALERARRHERDLLAEIARRQQAEEALHKSEALFRAISEQIPDSLFLLDLDDPDVHVKIIYANEAASVMHGYPLEEIIGRSIAFLNDPVTTEKMPERVERLLAGETLAFEGVHRRKDGTVFPVEVTSRLIDYGGRKVAVALDRDISERKQAEEALRLKVEQLDALNRASRAVTASLELDQVLAEIVSLTSEMAAADYASVILMDETGCIKQSAENIPGIPAVEYRVRDRGLTNWIVHSHQAVIVDEIGEDGAVAPELGEGAPYLANPYIVKAGVKSVAGLPLMVKDRLLGVLYLHSRRPNAFHDLLPLLTAFANQVAIAIENARLHEQARQEIAERQRAEAELQTYAARLERSNRELESFAYIASHDLKEPLRKIQAFGDRLQAKYGEVLNDQGRDYLIRMQSAATRMQALIDGLLIYSRVTTKAQPFVTVDLNAVVREVLADLEVRIEQLAARVEVADLPTIEADPLQMRQLFQNLIGNALKFHRQGVVPLVQVRGELLDSGAGQYRITVEDNGIGFDEKYLDRLFQVFQRLQGRSEYEGAGIGLAICRKIVERHGGSITARSVPGQGATFIVTLPARQPAKEIA